MCSRCMGLRNEEDDAKPDDDISCMGTEDGDDNSMLELNSIDEAQYVSAIPNNVSLHPFNLFKCVCLYVLHVFI